MNSAKCLICSKLCKVSQGNTSTLWRHAESNHKRELGEAKQKLRDQQPTLLDIVQKKQEKYKPGDQWKKELDVTLVSMIASNLQPISIGEDQGFVQYSEAPDKEYQLLARKTLCNVLPPISLMNSKKKFDRS